MSIVKDGTKIWEIVISQMIKRQEKKEVINPVQEDTKPKKIEKRYRQD